MSVRLSLLLVVVLIIVGGTVVITQRGKTAEPQIVQPWMYRVDMEDITDISVVHKGERQDYELQDKQWVIKDGNDTPVFIDRWAGTTLILSGPRSSRALADQVDDPAKYGLDSPQTSVTLENKSGAPLVFHLGDPTPDGNHWYAKVEGSEMLFTVASLWGETISRLVNEPPYTPTPEPPFQLPGQEEETEGEEAPADEEVTEAPSAVEAGAAGE